MKSPQRPGDDVITTRQPSGGIVPGLGFAILVADGPHAGRGVQMSVTEPRRVLVGKSPVCDLQLADPMVSRRHAAFELTGMRLGVTDLDSTNGTFVNEVSVASAYLRGGERVRVGSTTLRIEMRAGAAAAGESAPSFGRLVGASPRMKVIFAVCQHLAAADVPIIVEGETGTGKELVSECLHEASARAAAPFVVFDCASTPRDAIERVLFGEVAPDGSLVRTGVFESANGGTVLLDEIGELPLEAQATLLRAIERGEIRRLGDDKVTRVNVRTIAATSRDLDKMVETGKFREDLFFRLAVGRVELPPLRRRVGDAQLLAEHFFRALTGAPNVPQDFSDRYQDYDWPGNVRELENAVARFVALGPVASLVPARARHAPSPGRAAAPEAPADVFTQVLDANLPFTQARQRLLDAFERAYVERVLAAHGGNVARAAAASGIARRYFQLIRARQSR